MPQPEIALLLSTYQRPWHLQRALWSIELQENVRGLMELVVTDDGSTDETHSIIEQFARSVDFPVRYTTHPHGGFQLARCRNEGVAASQAPYLLFLDGDCVLPRDHVRIHLDHRKPMTVLGGDCCRFGPEDSERIDEAAIRSGDFERWAAKDELRRLRRQYRSSRFYRLIRHPLKPKIIGNNVALWRSDYERVNGYDENFRGWGCEDDDLRLRLRRAGVQIESILRWTCTYHIWHPTDATQPVRWRKGVNVPYLLRKGRLTCCRNGLVKRRVDDLTVQIIGRPARPHFVAALLKGRFQHNGATVSDGASQRSATTNDGTSPEVELLFLPGEGSFSGRAECNVLVSLEPLQSCPWAARKADLVIAPGMQPQSDSRCRPLEQFEEALESVA